MTQKEVAVQIMKNMIKYKPIITAFEKSNTVMYSDGPLGASYDAASNYDLMAAIERVEKEYGCLVFHATHTLTNFGDLYELLVVSKYEEEWQDEVEASLEGRCFCWVENISDSWCSEFGDCYFEQTPAGDIRRAL